MSADETTQVLPPYDDDVELDVPTNGVAGASVLDALRATRARVAQARTYDLVVPGWFDLLVLRLGAVTSEQMQRLAARATRRGSSVASGDVDLLIAAFREVLGRAKPDGELAVLVDDDGDPVGLDERLAELVDLGPVRSARDVVAALFSRSNSPPIALSSAMAEWVEWARGANDEIDEGFLGE